MKKIRLLLSAALLISLLAGCGNATKDSAESNYLQSTDKTATTTSTTAVDKTTTQVKDTTSNQDNEQNDTTTKADKPTTKKADTTTTTILKTTSTQKPITTTKKETIAKNTTTTIKKTEKSTETSTTKTTITTTTKTKPNHGTPNITGAYHTDMANAVFSMVNLARQAAGLSALQMDNGNMLNAANIRAKEITILFSHERPDHAAWHTVFTEENVTDILAVGENLADGQTTAEKVFNDWMNSPLHKDNIMHKDFTHISISAFEYNGKFYWVQLFKQAKSKK